VTAAGVPEWATLVRAPNPSPMTLEGTNTWVLRAPGAPACVVVDPGPDDDGHLSAVAAHAPVAAVLLTHGHPDHTDGVPGFGKKTDNPAVRSDDLADGDALAELVDVTGLRIEVLATPGHTADSRCFAVGPADRRPTAMLTGDTVLGRGTTVVAWPDGRLGAYLDSLRRLHDVGAAHAPMTVLTGHGPVLPDLAEAAAHYLAHRAERLAQVRTALAEGAETAAEVVAMVYRDTDRALWPAAEMSVRAQLEYLDFARAAEGGNAQV
jgi:glyoxylase-like metal-dependent hydrolase (beta-lactamase superfamily II)